MTTEQLQGAKLFVDAMNADLKANKTNEKTKIGLILKLKTAINNMDATKAMWTIKQYLSLCIGRPQ
jgi:hypothetical protein